MRKIKRRPLCGAKGQRIKLSPGGAEFVRCAGLDCEMHDVTLRIETWNCRATTVADAVQVPEVKALVEGVNSLIDLYGDDPGTNYNVITAMMRLVGPFTIY